MNKNSGNDSGQSVVIMALALVVIIGIMAVAIDGGRIYTTRRDAQNAADSAALQGARSLCRDEDYEATALNVAERGGFSGAGVVKVNSPPILSNTPSLNDDRVEVVITATIQGGFLAPILYDDEINTLVQAVGDCLRGDLTGSGSAIFAGATGCDTPETDINEIDLNGASITIVGGVHSNSDGQITGGGQGNVITGTVSHVGGIDIDSNTTLFPASGNPLQTTPKEYPIELAYADFVPGGWAYDAIIAEAPGEYHFFPDTGHAVRRQDFVNHGWMDGSKINPGIYVSPKGYNFSGASGNGIFGDGVTFVTLGKIDFSGSHTYLRPYFSGLLMYSEGFGDPCDNNPIIKMSGSSVSWGGIIFAPFGNVDMSFSSSSTFYGSIVAATVDVSGSDSTIIYDPSYLPPDPDTIELGQ